MIQPIGGYFGFDNELVESVSAKHQSQYINLASKPGTNVYYFNSLTNGLLYYLAQCKDFKNIHIPTYICPSFKHKLYLSRIVYKEYEIDASLSLPWHYLERVKENEILLLVNYFGILDSKIKLFLKAALDIGIRVIVDSAHSILYQCDGAELILYSPRKFIGIPDGGIIQTSLQLNLDGCKDYVPDQRCLVHLSLRQRGYVQDGYKYFLQSERILANSKPFLMSTMSKNIIYDTNLNQICSKRNKNFRFLHLHLRSINQFLDVICDSEIASPLYYPLLVEEGNRLRNMLIQNQIFSETLHKSVIKG